MSEDANSRKRLGDFEIIRELGRGGMGIVYETRQVSLNRNVALKVISSGLGMSPTAVERFQREAAAAGKLHHAHIVPIFATGVHEGVHYYAMELIDGPSLDRVIAWLRGGARKDPPSSDGSQTRIPAANATTAAVEVAEAPLEPRATGVPEDPQPQDDRGRDSGSPLPSMPGWVHERLAGGASFGARGNGSDSGSDASRPKLSAYFDQVAELIAGVASGLDYAHGQGVVHRDIKPANLLLSRDGRLTINDFGLARLLEEPGLTTTGEFVGSPLYMSPEQIASGRTPLDHRTDVYSLGTTLYQLLTLEPPVRGETREEILANILHKSPVPPRQYRRQIPVDLETICLKAMERDPDRRYVSCGQFAQDLRRFVAREPILARRVGPHERALRWIGRHRALSASVAIAIVFAVGMVNAVLQSRAERRDRAEEQAMTAALSGKFRTAEERLAVAEANGSSSSWLAMMRGQIALLKGETTEAIERLEQAKATPPDTLAERSILATAQFAHGDWFGYRESVTPLLGESTPDVSPEDLLFLGTAQVWSEPSVAVRTLEMAVKEKPSPFCFAMLSRARSLLAIERDEPTLAELALDDAVAARAYLRSTSSDASDPISDSAELLARLVLSQIRLEEPEEADSQLRRAAEPATRLASRALPQGRQWRYYYMLLRNDFEGVLDAFRDEDGTSVIPNFNVWPFSSAVLGGNRLREGIRSLDETVAALKPPIVIDVSLARVTLLAATGDERDRVRAWDSYRELLRRLDEEDLHPEVLGAVLALPCLLGDVDRASADAEKRLAGPLGESLPSDGPWVWPRTVSEVIAGRVTEERLREKVWSSRAQRGEAYYVLGTFRLAQGNRTAAERCFRDSVESGAFFFHGPSLAQGFLALMDADKTWPRWIEGE